MAAKISCFLHIWMLSSLSIATASLNDLSALERELNVGEQQYQNLLKNTELPMYGQCWTSALEELKSGCSSLTEDTQNVLALKFTNCMLDMTGQEQVVCGSEGMRKCLATLGDRPFMVYQNFFTSTRSMCHFLRIQVWHEQTEMVIGKLASNSKQVAEKLIESKEVQDSIAESQKKTLQELQQQTESSKQHIKQMFDELQDRTEQHGALIFEIFDRIGKLQSYVLGEVESFYSVFFYLSAVLLAYLTTSVPRTSGARLFLFAVILSSFLAENSVRKLVVTSEDSIVKNVDELQETVRYWTSTIRYLTSWSCLLTLVICAWRFRDYNKLNHRLLMEIQKQNEEMRFLLKTLGPAGSQISRADVTDGQGVAPLPLDVSYGLELNESYVESSYDTDSDETYLPEDSEIEDIDGSYSPPVLSPELPGQLNESREIMPYLRPEISPEHIEAVPQPRYALRPRSGVIGSANQQVRETPEEFYAVVRLHEKLARRRRKRLLRQLADVEVDGYSSQGEVDA